MTIKGVVNRVATIGGTLSNTTNLRAKQVSFGSGATDLGTKSIQELSDVNASETDKGLLTYNSTTDKWETTTTIDGGTF
tara:strand:+ start:360 stop:596 length:237 start_codon:yes stop_codon:yes gene_type:complete